MNYRTFVFYNIIGAFLWGVGLTLLGFFLGQIAFVEEYAEFFIIGIVLLSGVPILIELYKAGRSAATKRRQPKDSDEKTVTATTVDDAASHVAEAVAEAVGETSVKN